jgi:hypothetical protein
MSKEDKKVLFSQVKKQNEELTAQLKVKSQLLTDCYNDLKAKLDLVKRLEIDLNTAAEHIKLLKESKEEMRHAGLANVKKLKILEELLGEDAHQLNEARKQNLIDQEKNIEKVKKLTKEIESLEENNKKLIVRTNTLAEQNKTLKAQLEAQEAAEKTSQLKIKALQCAAATDNEKEKTIKVLEIRLLQLEEYQDYTRVDKARWQADYEKQIKDLLNELEKEKKKKEKIREINDEAIEIDQNFNKIIKWNKNKTIENIGERDDELVESKVVDMEKFNEFCESMGKPLIKVSDYGIGEHFPKNLYFIVGDGFKKVYKFTSYPVGYAIDYFETRKSRN